MVTRVAVGQRVKRLDAPAKLTGQERFTSDLRMPGLLHARAVTSPYAHARILNIDASEALKSPGVVRVLAASDLPLTKDAQGQPARVLMATDEVFYAGQFVALVLAETEAAAEDAVSLVDVEYEPLDVLADADISIHPDASPVRLAPLVIDEAEASMHNADAAIAAEENAEIPHPNVSSSVHFARGDVNEGFAKSDAIVELEFVSSPVHQGYIETQGCLVSVDPLGNVQVYTSTQASFHCRNRVADTIGVPVQQVTVKPMPVGGGFGGKFVLIEPLVAAAAVAVGRPVLLQFTRMDDFMTGNPAPGCRISVKLGATADGEIQAVDANLLFASGAGGGSPLQIAAVLLGGYYRFPNLQINGKEVLTHRMTPGAYRAPGAQQATFAIESAVDELARKLRMDPLDFRIRNCVVEGDPRPNGAPWPRIGLKECLEALRDHPAWQNREAARAAGHGVGIAAGGWPGGIEPATAVCRLDANGKMTVVLGSVDLSGTNTTFAQIAAESLGLKAEDVVITTASTDAAPFAGGTGGSKITYTVGAAVLKAAEDARQQLLSIAAQHLEAAIEDLELSDGMVRVKGVPGSGVSLKQIAGMTMSVAGKHEPVYGTGSSAIIESAPGFAVHLVEANVDEATGETRIERYVAVQDVGFAINPAAVEGQIHGGVVQGLGWALYEGMAYDNDGQLLTATLLDYTLPRATMAPNIECVFVEVPSTQGAYGAKGVGEPPAIPGPAAVANAVRDAISTRVTTLPMLPEVLARAIWQRDSAAAD